MAVYYAKLRYSNRMDKQCRFSYTAKCKRKVILLAEKEGNRHAALEFSVPESNVHLWRKHKNAIFACKQSWKKFTGHRKRGHPEVDHEVLQFVLEWRKNGLPVTGDIIREKANEVARARNIQRHVFKASRGWVDRFMRCNGLSLRRHTAICQKLPTDFEEKLVNFQRHVIMLQKTGNFLMGQIGNMDETPIWLDMLCNYTVEQKGTKQVPIRTSGCENQHITVMLGTTVDGHKLPPFLIFKRKTPPRTPKNAKLFPTDILMWHQENGWMMHQLMFDWLENVWGWCPGALLNLPSILCLDAFQGYITNEIKNKLVITPAGIMSVLQPMDVSINKPSNAQLSEQYERWISDHDEELTASGKIKCAPPHIIAHWVSSAWTSIPAELVAKSFKKCCISNALDGTEDDLLWDDDEDNSDLTTEAATTYCWTVTMLVKTRIPHETKLPSVIQVPYSSTFVKITAVHVRITFVSKVFF